MALPSQDSRGGRADRQSDERSPLLQRGESYASEVESEEIDFDKEDSDNPKQWTRRKKLTNVGIIALMSILSPLASSMFTPGIAVIAKSLHTSVNSIIVATTGFVIMLGIGPLILAPLSETFGRRKLYMVCFSIFTLLHIPMALAPNVAVLITARTIAGFFGSVGIANGGGTISDMCTPEERAGIFGWYLLGPLLGPTIGPLLGGVIVEKAGWRWVFWIVMIVCAVNTLIGYFFLYESYAPIILQRKCEKLQKERGGHYTYPGQDNRALKIRIWENIKRPVRILFTQPIVLTMAAYQAVIFGTMYSLYTNMQDIYGNPPYNFSTSQVGLLYLGPGLGFLTAVWFLVPRIDTVFNKMTKENGGESRPEFRLPLANIGAVLLPVTLFIIAWTIEYRDRVHWIVSIIAAYFLGLGQVMIFNTVQNYYIDAFAKYAASAIAAGATFRAIVGGVVPLFAPAMFEKLGYGWGWSVFAFLCVALAPAPLLFQKYGPYLRERFAIEL